MSHNKDARPYEPANKRILIHVMAGAKVVFRFHCDWWERDEDVLARGKVLARKLGKTLPRNSRIVRMSPDRVPQK